MQAVIYNCWGGPGALMSAELSDAALRDDAVRIKIAWAGVNPADSKLLSGKYKWLCRGGFPRRIGLEAAGRVSAVGKAVTGFEPGMEVVFGLSPLDGRTGAWAEQVDVDAKRVIPVPAGIDMRAAAVLPIAGLTALLMCQMTDIGPGKDVLISGASGGVGHLAVQIAKHLEGRVSAMGSEINRPLLARLGAADFIDYRTSPPHLSGRQWDCILDCVNVLRPYGNTMLRRGGRYVDTDPRPLTLLGDPLMNPVRSRKRKTVAVDIQKAGMETLFGLMAAGEMAPVIMSEYGLDRAADALVACMGGHVAGKLVLKIGGA
jgi:NADPH:quinone reductase-like Zn-dependent oxidoreductase